jgi:hypothetical protein
MIKKAVLQYPIIPIDCQILLIPYLLQYIHVHTKSLKQQFLEYIEMKKPFFETVEITLLFLGF